MLSKNFEFLRSKWSELAELGAFAEQYAHPDPPSAVAKLRTYAEQIVAFIFHEHGLPRLHQPTFHDLLSSATFIQVVPSVVLDKLHTLRIYGNKGAHGEAVLASVALNTLRDAYDLGCWMHLQYGNGKKDDCPPYSQPAPGEGTETERRLRREKAAFLQHLAAQEAEIKKLLAQIEAERAKKENTQQTPAQLQSVQTHGQEVADSLAFDEAATRRRLIDTALTDAGWTVGEDGASSDQVGQEVPVNHQPTARGQGKADYVLWGPDGKPLGVIEAKSTSRDAEAGRTQAKLYADGLEKMFGQRPVIFYTNGHDIWMWHDAAGQPQRKLYGFYSPDSLIYQIEKRKSLELLPKTTPKPDIAGRPYQMEVNRKVIERYAGKHRSALLVMATGTGKTRVAVSLCDVLLRARWAKRILFLCDRVGLRTQAKNAFVDYLPAEPNTVVSSATVDRDKRIYLATYPSIMECYDKFDVGFFDLIIADETHRSIYKRYRDLFTYFDGLKLGLTATPLDFISRNTFNLFGCDEKKATATYDYETALNDHPPSLVPYKVVSVTTEFLRKGIKYSEMSPEKRQEIEENENQVSSLEYEPDEIDRLVFNKDTSRIILRKLLEEGIKDKDQKPIGKSIIFARNYEHAKFLRNLFYEMNDQYNGEFCQIITSHDPRADSLLDSFKVHDPEKPFMIAISVDMLDTGVDVPEVVNLVFAKPVFSKVKFLQMIGRGTRLCQNLFGPGKHKTHFRIFDYWGNFKYFEEKYTPVEPPVSKSLLQRVFESRVELADAAREAQNLQAFDLAISLIVQDIADLPPNAISVKEKWRQVEAARDRERLNRFEPATRSLLLNDIAPLMQWRSVGSYSEAHDFDLLVSELQTEHLKESSSKESDSKESGSKESGSKESGSKGSSSFNNLKNNCLNRLNKLRVNLREVRAVESVINEVRTQEFWNGVNVAKLENLRDRLRGVMQFQEERDKPLPPKVIDITEDKDKIVTENRQNATTQKLAVNEYRNRVEEILRNLLDNDNDTLKRIKQSQPVSAAELDELVAHVHKQGLDLDLRQLLDYYPHFAGQLDVAIRSIIGLDAALVAERFSAFLHRYSLDSRQINFLRLLQNHIVNFGYIELDRVYEPPFTAIDPNSIDGLFSDEAQIESLLAIIETFQPSPPEKTSP